MQDLEHKALDAVLLAWEDQIAVEGSDLLMLGHQLDHEIEIGLERHIRIVA